MLITSVATLITHVLYTVYTWDLLLIFIIFT